MERMTRNMPFSDSSGKVSYKAMFSYIFDYAIIIVLALIYGALDKIVSPFSQRFSLTDITIQYPYSFHERIPIAMALVISAGFPIVVILVYTLIIDGIFSHSKQKGVSKYTFKQRLWELNCGILGLLLAQGAAFCITGTLKNLVGRPRPDLISRCLPQQDARDLPVFGLSAKTICTQTTASIMQDAFRSFPSGHSSSSFAGLGYLSLYLTGKLHVLDQRGEVWRTVIVLVPLVAASCIAASRIMDYRHHPEDVLIGSALGLLCAWGSYRQYFPALSHTWLKGRAFPMREWGVPVRRPEDYHGVGYNNDPARRHGQPEELSFRNEYAPREEDQAYALEPMRAPRRSNLPSPAFEHVPLPQVPSEDTDYEMVRPKAYAGIPIPGIQEPGNEGTNVFREQVNRNQSQRRSADVLHGDEEDLGTRNMI